MLFNSTDKHKMIHTDVYEHKMSTRLAQDVIYEHKKHKKQLLPFLFACVSFMLFMHVKFFRKKKKKKKV